MSHFITDQAFDKSFLFKRAEYDNCTFGNCDFSGEDLSGSIFNDCSFVECNFSMAKITQCGFREVAFKNCKLLGLRFDESNAFLFSAKFDGCMLNLSSFYRMKLRKIKFSDCSLHETDFAEADLEQAQFANCDLANAVFSNTILEMADLRTAYNFSIDPNVNYIRKARFSLSGLPGLLSNHDIEIDN